MEHVTKNAENRTTRSESHVAQSIIVTVFGLIEAILAFRLIFKLLGANPENWFVRGIYTITGWYVGIFEGIFSKATTAGAETTAVFEPGTLIAMVVIALLAWIVLRLVRPRVSKSVDKTEYTEHDDKSSRF
jgi:hypothetical protein